MSKWSIFNGFICLLHAGVVLDDGTSLRADLVVDASGRKSRTPEWLKERDLQAPEMIRVDPHVAVASRMVKMPGNWDQVSKKGQVHWGQ